MIPFKTIEDWNWVHWEAITFRKQKIDVLKKRVIDGVPLTEEEKSFLKFWKEHYGIN